MESLAAREADDQRVPTMLDSLATLIYPAPKRSRRGIFAAFFAHFQFPSTFR